MQNAHGEYVIVPCGDIITVSANGPWNKECVIQFAEEYNVVRSKLNLAQWSDIIVVMGESLFVPEAEEAMRFALKKVEAAGLTHIAIVLGHSKARNITKMQFKKLYKDSSMIYEFVDTTEDAVSWLESCGFSADQEEIAEYFSSRHKLKKWLR